jgi:hypothetical protein
MLSLLLSHWALSAYTSVHIIFSANDFCACFSLIQVECNIYVLSIYCIFQNIILVMFKANCNFHNTIICHTSLVLKSWEEIMNEMCECFILGCDNF